MGWSKPSQSSSYHPQEVVGNISWKSVHGSTLSEIVDHPGNFEVRISDIDTNVGHTKSDPGLLFRMNSMWIEMQGVYIFCYPFTQENHQFKWWFQMDCINKPQEHRHVLSGKIKWGHPTSDLQLKNVRGYRKGLSHFYSLSV